MTRFEIGLLCTVAAAVSAVASDAPLPIPSKPDPPIAIDGDTADWAAVPNAIPMSDPAQVVWGAGAWQSPRDLSGTARVAWRAEHLFVAAEVTDDVLAQTQRGDGIWKGDHVELYLDVQPGFDPARDSFGAGQFHFAFSPGNFKHTGDPLADCPPEAVCYTPARGSVEGIAVAAKRTEAGYTLEAAIPWALLGVNGPEAGMPLRIEIGFSDTDNPEPQQESMMTRLTAEWGHTRSRLGSAMLAGADGAAVEMAQGQPLFGEVRVKPNEKYALEFNAPPAPAGKLAVIRMRARMQYDKVAGLTTGLRMSLNGTTITADRLLNKPLRVKARCGDVYSMAAGESFSTFYSPDFTSTETDPHYGLLDGVQACEFELVVDGLLKEGQNSLIIEHAAPTVPCDLVVADGQLAFRLPPPPEKQKAGPPTGPLDMIEPRPELRTNYTVTERPGCGIEVTVGGETFVVESQFSTPTPGWAHESNTWFSLQRKVEQLPEAVIISDTFTNLTDANLPLMRRNQVKMGERVSRLWLAGLEQSAKMGSQANPANPTAFAATAACGIGLLPLDDVARLHVANYAADGTLGLADNNLVLPPRASYTAQWAIIPTDAPDYWTFINAARRLVDANFTIDGGFAFFRADPLTDVWTDAQIADFLRFKDAYYVCASISYPMYKGRYTHGTSFQLVTHDNYRESFRRWRALKPDSKYLVYFHCFIDVTDEAPQQFADARVLRSDGTHADYGQPYDRIYFPTQSNSFGREVGKNVDIILDEIGADGVYWDEHEYSRYLFHHGEPWDGFSGDVDPTTMQVARLKSSVTLLTEPWRVALATKILERGPLVGNSPPYTRAMAALKFPCFVETGSITHCTQSHLYSPIALGDHLTERSEIDAYRTMLAALDYGCVYHWYNDVTVIPTHPHLTSYMYPITPMELHQGYIIGKERIITKVSGRFGWRDSSQHEVHVFDDTGREVEAFNAPFLTEGGTTFTELRLPEDWSAAIVRR